MYSILICGDATIPITTYIGFNTNVVQLTGRTKHAHVATGEVYLYILRSIIDAFGVNLRDNSISWWIWCSINLVRFCWDLFNNKDVGVIINEIKTPGSWTGRMDSSSDMAPSPLATAAGSASTSEALPSENWTDASSACATVKVREMVDRGLFCSKRLEFYKWPIFVISSFYRIPAFGWNVAKRLFFLHFS